MIARTEYLNGLIGKPWRLFARGPDAYDCWELALEVQRSLFCHELPRVDAPDHLTWRWLINQMSEHPEYRNWIERRPDAAGLVTAADGAMVLMARRDRPAHTGVWLAPERAVIHADPTCGVSCEDVGTLRAKGWTRLRFYEARR